MASQWLGLARRDVADGLQEPPGIDSRAIEGDEFDPPRGGTRTRADEGPQSCRGRVSLTGTLPKTAQTYGIGLALDNRHRVTTVCGQTT